MSQGFTINPTSDTTRIPYTEKGVALGVATLDASVKVPLTQLYFVTDGTLSGNSDLVFPSEKAIKTYADTKEPLIAIGFSSQYWRGDKTWQTLDKSAVGLSNVDNTSDLNKPISTATQTALNAKVTGNTAITIGTFTKLTVDSKGLVTLGAQASLSDLSDISFSSPQVDQILKFNGLTWTNGNPAVTGVGSGINLFFSNDSSGISTYDLLDHEPDTASEVDENVSVINSTSPLFIDAYIDGTAIGKTLIDSGVWAFNVYASANPTGGGSSYLQIDIYKRTSGGTETLLFSTTSPEIIGTSPLLYIFKSAQPSFSVNATDKLLIKVYATHSNSNASVVHFYHSGTTHYSFIQTPLIASHNDLSGLQGGSSAEYYHLTATEYAGTGSGVFVRSSGPTITTPIGIVKGDVGLGNVDNTSDASKPISTATQTALNAKEPAITSGSNSQYWRGDKSWQTLDTSAVTENSNLYFTNARAIGATLTGYTSGAGTITSADTLLSAIQKLNGNVANKEPTITAGSNSQYWRGDKSWQTLDTSAVTENSNLYFTNARAIGATLTGYTSGAGAITAADTLLSAIQKLNGNDGLKANLSGGNTFSGKQVMTAVAGSAGINIGVLAENPSSLTDGDAWINSSTGEAYFRVGGVSLPLSVLLNIQVIASGTTYTPTTGTKTIRVRMMGGGGGGGGASGNANNIGAGAGGGAGAYMELLVALTGAANYTVAVGGGGTAGANSGGTGGTGGSTTLTIGATTYTCLGGVGGVGQSAGTAEAFIAGGAGAAAPTGGLVMLAGCNGFFSHRRSGTLGVSGQGADSPLGAGGLGLTASANGNTGLGYGSGGGGALTTSATARTGGAGGGGVLIIEEYS